MKNCILLSVAFATLFLLLSCGPAVPTKEIESAKSALERAKTVEAPVYAAQDFMQAQDDLNQANNFVDQKKNKEALDKAVASKAESDKAYETAREGRAQNIFQKCGDLLNSADSNFADRVEPDKYNDATNKYANLKTLNDQHDYDSVYSNGNELYPELKELSDSSAAMVKEAQDIFQKCGELLNSADQNFADKVEPDKYNDATNKYADLQTLNDQHDYGSVYSNGNELYPELKELSDNSAAMVAKAKDAIAGAQDRYDEAAEKEIVKQFAMDDLKTAGSLLDDARGMLDQGNLNDAVSKANDAIAIIDAAEKKADLAYRESMKIETNAVQTIDLEKQKELDKEKQEAMDAIKAAKQKYEQLKEKTKGSFLRSCVDYFAFIELPFIYFGDEGDSSQTVESNSENTNSIETNTEETNTVEATPAETNVEETNAEETNAVEAAPAETNAEETNAVEAAPAETNAEETNAVETPPAETNAAAVTPENPTNIPSPSESKTSTFTPVKDEDITQDMVEKYIKLAEDAYNRGEYLDSIDYAKEASRMADILLAREQFKIYTVRLRPGNRDCLWKISGYMYNDQYSLWPLIWEANKYQITDPDLIYPGQELKIPPLP